MEVQSLRSCLGGQDAQLTAYYTAYYIVLYIIHFYKLQLFRHTFPYKIKHKFISCEYTHRRPIGYPWN